MNLDKIIREEIQKLKLNEAAGKTMPDTFFDQVVQKLGGQPTEEKRKFFRAWKRAEGTAAKFNPLATTLKLKDAYGGSSDMEGSVNKGRPVQDYPTIDAGIDATYWTLKNTYGGKAYQNLVNGLKSDDVTAEELANQTAELATWSKTSGKYVADQLPYVADQVSTSSADNTTTNNLDISKEKDPSELSDLNPSTQDSDTELIDKIQTILDFAGFIPYIGDALDIVNGVIYLIRGRYVDALLSLVALIPVAGSIIAVPLRIAFKASRKFISPKLLKAAFSAQPGAWEKILLRLTDTETLGKVALDSNTLEALAKGGDDIAKMLLDGSGKLKTSLASNNTIVELSKRMAQYAEVFTKMSDEAAALARGVNNAATQSGSLVGQAGKLSGLSKLYKGVGNFMLSGRLVRAISKSDTALTSVAKKFGKQFDKTMIDSNAYSTLFTKSMRRNGFASGIDRLDPRTINALKGHLARYGSSPNFRSGPEFLQAMQNSPQVANQFKKALPDILKDTRNFKPFIQNVTTYKQVFIKQQSAAWKNVVSKPVGIEMLKRGIIPPAGARGILSNVNGFKVFAKLFYIGDAMENSGVELFQTWGTSLRNLANTSMALTGILSLGEMMSDEDKATAQQLSTELEQTQIELDKITTKLEDINTSEFTQDQLELLQMVMELGNE